MADKRKTIARAFATPTPTGGSFEEEQRSLLYERCRLLFLVGLAISLISLGISWSVPSADPQLQSPLLKIAWVCQGGGHALAFLLGLILLRAVRDDRGKLQFVAFSVTAFSLLLAVFSHAAYAPAVDPYFAVALLLFLPAAFVPWRTSYQAALGVTAVVSFTLLNILLYALLPEFRAYWAELGGVDSVRYHLIWGATGTAIFASAAVLVSSTLYSLQKSAHRAKRLGSYLIHAELGRGGMGQVYVAQHALMCRPTAVKVMRATDTDQQTALARFEREIRLSATLTHPNTITIYDVGRTPDQSVYYAMEYLEGLDLQQLVERFGPVPAGRTVFILRQICGSLGEAHSRGIIHRDIKPSNIFLTRRGGLYDYVKVLDFGLAKRIDADGASGISKSGVVFGTPRYIAPEMVYGSDKIDGRADLYCLGGVAYWMLTGQPPFTSDSSVEVVIDHVKTPPQRPSEISELAIPAELEAIVLKCLEKKPEDRFATSGELENALAAVPVQDLWSRELAEDWWQLHGIVSEQALDQQCFFDEGAAAEEQVLVARG